MSEPIRRLPSITKEVYSSLTLKKMEELLKPYFHELAILALEHHARHSNVGPTERLKEWSTCRYSYCRKRYDMLYENRETLEV